MGTRSWATLAVRRRFRALSRPHRGDGGFTLVEVIVAIGLIGVVMASLSTFYVQSVATTNMQSGRQAAVQVALDAMEQARSVDPAELLTGRTNGNTNTQWTAAPARVAPHLADMVRAWGTGTGTAKLPTTPQNATVNGVAYQQHWYVGSCWQPTTSDAVCGATQPTGSVQMYRVVVAVTWQERSCGASACAYVASTLISPAADDPIFNAHSTLPPSVEQPDDQTSVADSPVSLPVVGSGGAPAIRWEGANMPPGLDINATTGIISGTPTTPGTYANVTVTRIDSLSRLDAKTFVWVITAAPLAVADPGTQTATAGAAATLQMTATGGTAPRAWSAADLPPGLTIDAGTGRITGTPSAAGSYTTRVTARDSQNRTSNAAFTWTVNPAPALTAPGAQRSRRNITVVDLPIGLNGGTGPFDWQASSLPNGLSINAGTGRITGTPTRTGTWSTRVTVTDKYGRTAPITFTWEVTS